ncbi:nuclear transport factor 2 family protein, partial [Chloroflexota bacterium]
LLVATLGASCATDADAVEDTIKDFFNAYNDGEYGECVTYLTNVDDEFALIALLADRRATEGDVVVDSIQNINITGATATASVTLMYAGKTEVDEMRLVKRNGGWKIDLVGRS